jgi:hypothetical protein
MKADMKMFKAKLSELMSMCGDDCEDEAGEEGEYSNSSVEPQDGQPKATADIDNGGQESLMCAGEKEGAPFKDVAPPEGNKKKKLDVIAASMKRKFGK